jgi:drug/metabolite transporter (DMT)-like permease
MREANRGILCETWRHIRGKAAFGLTPCTGAWVDEKLSGKGLFHLCIVYSVWSTTYLAMRVGVGFSSSFPPFMFGLLRMPLAALILLIIARIQGLRMRPTSGELWSLCVVGNLLWLGGHGLILWASQYADSGFTCLMASSAPIWAAVVELFLYRKRLSLPLIISLLVGFTGMAILSSSSMGRQGSAGPLVILALITGPLSWALGSVMQSRRPVNLAPHVMSGYHHLAATLGFLLVCLLVGEPAPHPTLSAWIAWGYLVIFGSVFAFTSYVISLKLLPIRIVMTYAYVNPVLALFLGWLVLNEPILPRTLAGAALVLLSVGAIFKVKQTKEASSF